MADDAGEDEEADAGEDEGTPVARMRSKCIGFFKTLLGNIFHHCRGHIL